MMFTCARRIEKKHLAGTCTNKSAMIQPLQAHQASCVEPDSADMDAGVEVLETIPDTPPEAGVHSPAVSLPLRSYASCCSGAQSHHVICGLVQYLTVYAPAAGSTEVEEADRGCRAAVKDQPALVAALSANPCAVARYAATQITALAQTSSHRQSSPCESNSAAALARALTQALAGASDTSRSMFACMLSSELLGDRSNSSSGNNGSKSHAGCVQQPCPFHDASVSHSAMRIRQLAIAAAFTGHPRFLSELEDAFQLHQKHRALQPAALLPEAGQATITQHLLLCPMASSASNLTPSSDGSSCAVRTQTMCGLGQLLHALLPLLQAYLDGPLTEWLSAQVQHHQLWTLSL